MWAEPQDETSRRVNGKGEIYDSRTGYCGFSRKPGLPTHLPTHVEGNKTTNVTLTTTQRSTFRPKTTLSPRTTDTRTDLYRARAARKPLINGSSQRITLNDNQCNVVELWCVPDKRLN